MNRSRLRICWPAFENIKRKHKALHRTAIPLRSLAAGELRGENMKYSPDIHHRRSIRLKEYDYSQVGLYFITICTQKRLCLFGEIEKGEMILNDPGIMIDKWWNELKHKYRNIELHEQIIMPNHFHGIMQIIHETGSVGADLRVCPVLDVFHVSSGQSHRIAPTGMEKLDERALDERALDERALGERALGEHAGSPLHAMIQWFKTMTTNEYIRGVKNNGWSRFNKKLWQRNYYEHIIRNEKSYYQISGYIQTNPLQWQDDKYHEKTSS